MKARKAKKENLYLHVDGDSFFVACELTRKPELKGKPVIVGADRGIAVAMSIEAKKLGITRGMPVFKIKKLYPQVVILPHHFDLYEDIASRLYQILCRYFNEVEVYSIDECFAIVEPLGIKFYGGEKKLLSKLKAEIEERLEVTYSLGIARTKALSKLASKLEKPGGLVVLLTREDEINALKKTSIDDIWGIGWRTVPKLRRLGMETAYDFANYSPAKIARDFSEPVSVLQKEFNGEEILQVKSDVDPRDQKSIQSTATFRPSSNDKEVITREISQNAEHACTEARELQLITNLVSFFIKTSDFKYKVDKVKLEEFTADSGVILSAITPKLSKLMKGKEKIRATGVMLHNLIHVEDAPQDLFGKQEKAIASLKVEEAVDKIRKKYGYDAIKRATSLGKTPSTYTPGNSFKKKK